MKKYSINKKVTIDANNQKRVIYFDTSYMRKYLWRYADDTVDRDKLADFFKLPPSLPGRDTYAKQMYDLHTDLFIIFITDKDEIKQINILRKDIIAFSNVDKYNERTKLTKKRWMTPAGNRFIKD